MDAQETPPAYTYAGCTDEKPELPQNKQIDAPRAYTVIMHKCKAAKSVEENGEVIMVNGRTIKTRSDVIVLGPNDNAATFDALVLEKLYKRFRLHGVTDKTYGWAKTIIVDKHNVQVDTDNTNAEDALKLLRQEKGKIAVYFAVKPKKKRFCCIQ